MAAVHEIAQSEVQASLLDSESASLGADRAGRPPHPVFEHHRLSILPLDRVIVVEVTINELFHFIILLGLAIRVNWHVMGNTAVRAKITSHRSATGTRGRCFWLEASGVLSARD